MPGVRCQVVTTFMILGAIYCKRLSMGEVIMGWAWVNGIIAWAIYRVWGWAGQTGGAGLGQAGLDTQLQDIGHQDTELPRVDRDGGNNQDTGATQETELPGVD